MSYARIAFAAVGAFVAYFVLGGASFAVMPSLKDEFLKYPAVYRSQEGIMKVMPAGMAFMFLSMAALAVMYALLYQGGSGVWEGARFGALMARISLTDRNLGCSGKVWAEKWG
jgi:hypothetical protein